MDFHVIGYGVYLLLSLVLTIWVAQVLFRNGQTFLIDIFKGDEVLAKSVNRLLVVGFYLLNIGFFVYNLKMRGEISNEKELIESLGVKLGYAILVLGGMHFFNLFLFMSLRKFGQQAANKAAPRAAGPPPVRPPASGPFHTL